VDSSADLENALIRHPAAAEAAVIAAKHPEFDERPVAVMVAKEGATVTAGELRAFLEPRFAKFWLPDRCWQAIGEWWSHDPSLIAS
jgi:fatty-acyl-CoA synthase